jgi:hypothetical protein
MAIDDIGSLRGQLREVFLDQALPSRWEEEWLFIPIDDPEADASQNAIVGDYESEREEWFDEVSFESYGEPSPTRVVDLPVSAPDIESNITFGGAPQQSAWTSPMPPPDAFAFYLPFHYFYPTWWGVYIILENAVQLAEFVRTAAVGALTRQESLTAVQIFLYAHEAFHHIVESFATRLEITHRIPIYRTGFNRYFGRTAGTHESVEEALANAYAYRRVKSRFATGQPSKREAALKALRSFIEQCPPGYNRAPEFFSTSAFDAQRGAFAEGNHKESLPSTPGKSAAIWDCFPHAFSGISRVTSRVNYVVRRDSTLAARKNLNLRYLRYRELQEKLKTLARCEPLRQGHGSHEIWKTPDGRKFPIPRHPGDIHRGLLASIIKQSGLQMSVTEFLAA